MLREKRSPVLLTGVMVAVAALGLACGSSNNNKTSKATNAAPSASAAAAAAAPSASAAAAAPTGGSPAAAAASAAAKPSAAANAASPAAPAASAKPADAAPDDQQKITINLGAVPETLDWQVSEFEQDIAVEHLLARGLFYFDKDSNVVPALAAQMPSKDNGGISADGMTYTIKLKPGQKFSDGNPLTAKDMAYTVQRAFDPKLAGNYASFFYDIVGAEAYNEALGTKDKPKTPSDAELQQMRDAIGVKAVDDTTLELKLTKPSGSFLTRMALWTMYPVEKSVIDKFGDKWTDPANIVGNGPYVLKENAEKDHITLAANPNYTMDPKPIIKTVTLREIEDPVQALNAWKNGEIDVASVPSQQAQQILNDASLKDQIHREPRAETRGWEFNNTQKPFDNAKVRMAFAKAVNRDDLIKAVYGGIGTPAATWLPPGLPGYDKANEEIQKFDPAAAKQLLADAGYPNGQGFPDVKLLLTDTPINKTLFDFLQKQIKDNLNITIQADLVDSKTRSSRYSNKQFSLFYGGWVQDYPNADDWLPGLWTTGDSLNKPGYSNPQFDAAVKTALAEIDPKKQAPLWSAAEKIMLTDAAGGWLYHGELVQLFKPKVKGMVGTGIDSSWFGSELFESTYIAK
ncbi:MAG TPA: peptide ABC transporter substrate-binding protein [Dehalococcoidia bacterium]|nr:peptide ABC transporter substrate-binding protein [Dehalococcoidia bacterium]